MQKDGYSLDAQKARMEGADRASQDQLTKIDIYVKNNQ